MFGRKSSFDDIIVIMLGAILSRGVVGANSFISTTAACAVMVVIHRVLSFITTFSRRADHFSKGKKVVLYSNGEIDRKNMAKTSISEDDLMQSLRLETKNETFDCIETAYLENNGRISFVLKKQP